LGNSRVTALGNSKVIAWGNSTVLAAEDSTITANGNSTVTAWGNSTVTSRDDSNISIPYGRVKIIDVQGYGLVKDLRNGTIVVANKKFKKIIFKK